MPEQRACSQHNGTFKPPTFLAFRLGRKRVARCPHCRKWTDLNAPARPEPATEHSDLHMSGVVLLRLRIEESPLEEI
jgi:hypothetical protein